MKAKIEVTGDQELSAAIKKLSGEVREKIAKDAVAAAMPVLLNSIRQNAVAMVGGEMGNTIANNVRAANMRKMSDAVGQKAELRPDDKFIHITKAGNRYFIPTAIEYGHYIAKRGEGRTKFEGRYGRLARSIERAGGQKTSPIPYMRRAADESEAAVQEIVTQRICDSIERYWQGNKG